MKIVPKYVIEFNIELDDTTTISYSHIIGFFINFNTPESLLDDVNLNNSSLSLDTDEVLDNLTIFDYLVSQGILTKTPSTWFFWVNDHDRLRTFIMELAEVHNDLYKNAAIYKRDFIIDNI